MEPRWRDSDRIAGGPQPRIRIRRGRRSWWRRWTRPARRAGYGSPQFLPDGNRFIFFVRHADSAKQGYYESALSDLGRKRLILATDRKACYVPNAGGDSPYLLYLQEQTLLARKT